MMRIGTITFFILELNAAIDTGKFQYISVDQAESHIKEGDLFSWLQRELADGIDLSLFLQHAEHDTDGSDARLITNELRRILDAYAGDERRKWGVERSGLCLILAWANELVQQSAGDTQYRSY